MSKTELVSAIIFGWLCGFAAGYVIFTTNITPYEQEIKKLRIENDTYKTKAIEAGVAEIKNGVFRYK